VGDVVSATLGTIEDVAADLGLDLAEAVPVGVSVTTPDAAAPQPGVEAPLGVAITVALPELPVADGVLDTVTGLLGPVVHQLGLKVD
jgi:hypothetical protein